MTAIEILKLIQAAQGLLPAALELVDIVKKLSSAVTVEDVAQIRAGIDTAITAEDAALHKASGKE